MADRARGARSRRRLAWTAAAIAALALAGLFLARARSDAADARTARAAPEPEPEAPAPAPAIPVAGAAEPGPGAPLPEPIARFLAATPYPDTTGRLGPEHEDLLRPNRRYERPRPIPDTLGGDPDAVVTWLFTADRYAYLGADVAHAWLEVRRGGEPLDVELVAATATREGRGGPLGGPQGLDFRAEGEGRWSADLPLHRFADHHGPILLEVRFEYAPGRTHQDALRIFYTPADRIPGRFAAVRDRLHEGSLRIELDVDLDQGGFYRFDANLYDAAGRPVAFVAWKGELPPGVQTVPLDVYGKVLRDAGVPGPYTVGEIRGYRFLDGQYPDREHLPDLPTRFETAAHPLEAFTSEPFVSDHERHMVELMLDDLSRGIDLAVPALPDPAAGSSLPPPDDDFEPSLPSPSDAAPAAAPGA